YVVERIEQRAHVIPVPMRDGDGLHVCERHPDVLAVSEKERSLRASIEQQLVVTIANVRGQNERQTELGTTQRRPRQLFGAGRDDIVELRRHVLGLTRVAVAHIVERYVDHEPIYGWELRHHRFQRRRRSPPTIDSPVALASTEFPVQHRAPADSAGSHAHGRAYDLSANSLALPPHVF